MVPLAARRRHHCSSTAPRRQKCAASAALTTAPCRPFLPFSARRCARSTALLLFATAFLFVPPTNAQPSAEQVKAAYIYNFTKFVTWPDGAFRNERDPIEVCALGDSVSSQALAPLQQRQSRGRRIAVRILERPTDTYSCHIVYIAEQSSERMTQWLSADMAIHALTVSDMPGFADGDGVIEFVLTEGARIRLRINLRNARARGLLISAQLLEVADVVIKGAAS